MQTGNFERVVDRCSAIRNTSGTDMVPLGRGCAKPLSTMPPNTGNALQMQ
jgi:hypothetical protein